MRALEARLAGINPGAPCLRADHGRIEVAQLFGLSPGERSSPAQALGWVGHGAAPAPRAELPPLSGLTRTNPFSVSQDHGLFARPGLGHGGAHGGPVHGGAGASHDGRITSQSIEIESPIPPVIFDLWLETLMRGASSDILRLKAVVHVEGLEHPFALHGVQHVFHPPVPLPHWPRGDRVSRVVVIGRDLPPGYLEESLSFLKSRPAMTEHRL